MGQVRAGGRTAACMDARRDGGRARRIGTARGGALAPLGDRVAEAPRRQPAERERHEHDGEHRRGAEGTSLLPDGADGRHAAHPDDLPLGRAGRRRQGGGVRDRHERRRSGGRPAEAAGGHGCDRVARRRPCDHGDQRDGAQSSCGGATATTGSIRGGLHQGHGTHRLFRLDVGNVEPSGEPHALHRAPPGPSSDPLHRWCRRTDQADPAPPDRVDLQRKALEALAQALDRTVRRGPLRRCDIRPRR